MLCQNLGCTTPYHILSDDWSEWSICSAKCSGTRTRSRTTCDDNNTPDSNSTPSCAEESQIEKCGEEECPGFSDWGSWSECSAECGYGTKKRDRKCDNPRPPMGSGLLCDGLTVEKSVCYLKSCPERSMFDNCTFYIFPGNGFISANFFISPIYVVHSLLSMFLCY